MAAGWCAKAAIVSAARDGDAPASVRTMHVGRPRRAASDLGFRILRPT
ncbi:hypothetical protein [Lentzea nigeriaca]|nr:hypothetical protein [Lentzea nigeriaca]MBM7863782.1 hypothetical protein [Lentzea nigeriaca]